MTAQSTTQAGAGPHPPSADKQPHSPTAEKQPHPPSADKQSGRWYVRSIVGLAAGTLALAGVAALRAGEDPILVGFALLLGILVALQAARTVVHTVLRVVLRPAASVPSLPLGASRAAVAASCMVYPVIVHDSADIDAVVDTMRGCLRDNGDGFAAHVALVDFADAATPDLDSDSDLRAQLEAKLAAFTPTSGSSQPLVALFRARRFNPVDNVWMGWERKRGKLVELTDLIEGVAGTSFQTVQDDERAIVQRLRGLRYVVTVDVGSRLPNRSAVRLVATLAHPDNRPVIDSSAGTVVGGFSFVRPCVSSAPPQSFFAWSWQPYSAPSGQASFGQVLFGQDLFLGQGAFDVVAFRAALTGRIPENSVLNHDKLEGMHARTACVANSVVVESGVTDYLSFRARTHRWIRGDVHLLPWVVTRGGSGLRSFPAVARWMLMSDLIDHLLPVPIVGLFALAWLAVPAAHVGWWIATIATVLLQPLLVLPFMIVFGRSTRPPGGLASRQRIGTQVRLRASLAFWLIRVELVRAPLWIVLLADRAVFAVDATVRALYRTTISHRRILQWTSSARADRFVARGVAQRWRLMAASCVLAVTLMVLIGVANPTALPWALPVLAGWILAPQVAYWASQPGRWLPFVEKRASAK